MPEDPAPDAAARPVLDRWLLSRLATVTRDVGVHTDAYNLTHAVRAIGDFVVDDLSNWYVRRSRDRFWGNADAADTRAAFATLYEALRAVSGLMAPFAPFLADWLHRALAGASVHLSAFPAADEARVDAGLEAGMDAVRTLSTLGRAAREGVGIRVRQPLGRVLAVIPPGIDVGDDLLAILRDELNVRRVEFMAEAEELVTFSARPNFKALGASFGKLTPRVGDAVRGLPSEALAAFRRGEPLRVHVEGHEVTLAAEHLEVVQGARGDFAVQAEGGFTLALDPALTPELRREGLARELVNRVQKLRKDSGLEVSDRIRLGVAGGDELREAVEAFRDFVGGETLAVEVEIGGPGGVGGRYDAVRDVDLDGVAGTIALARAPGEP
jgi:isoleucyl-tRNA synthetase